MRKMVYIWRRGAAGLKAYALVHQRGIRFFMCFLVMVVLPMMIGGSGCEAAESKKFPWSDGVNVLFEEFTDVLPSIGSAISIAVSAILWLFGESQITKTAIRVAFATGIGLAAPDLINALTGKDVSGCLF